VQYTFHKVSVSVLEFFLPWIGQREHFSEEVSKS
jgi:hypothetical protein